MVFLGAENALGDNEQTGLIPFVHSKVFTNIFAHGMELVEETATYLDNGGRRAAKALDRESAMTYAGVSMRLTTRLMQIASWLLVLRAVRDEEMSEDEARDEKYRVGSPEPNDRAAADLSAMPEALRDLIEQTDTLYARIARLDRDLFVGAGALSAESDAKGRLDALRRAFSTE